MKTSLTKSTPFRRESQSTVSPTPIISHPVLRVAQSAARASDVHCARKTIAVLYKDIPTSLITQSASLRPDKESSDYQPVALFIPTMSKAGVLAPSTIGGAVSAFFTTLTAKDITTELNGSRCDGWSDIMGEYFDNTFTVSPDQPIPLGATMKPFSIPHYQNLFRNSKDDNDKVKVLAEYAMRNGLCGDAPDIFHELVAMVEPVQKAA